MVNHKVQSSAYNFKRYPGQIVPVKNEMREQFGGSSIGTSMIHYYDHLIIQLDMVIFETSEDEKSSIVLNGLSVFDLINNMCLFANNKCFLENINFYMEKLEIVYPAVVSSIKEKLKKYDNFETLDLKIMVDKTIRTPDFIKGLFGEFKPEEFKLPTSKGKWSY